MSAIEKRRVLDREKLDEKNYFSSLIALAGEYGMLTDRESAQIQSDSVSLLAKLTEELTGGQSSSVSVERARELMDSITFTVGIYLKNFPSPDEALEALKKEGMHTAFEKGQRRIAIMIKTTSLLHERLKRELILTKNECYRATAVEGIDGFFRLYRPQFGAHMIHITADYPTCMVANGLGGIEFIRQYVHDIYLENYFCSRFEPGSVHRLLKAYNKDYGELIFNIFTPVLTTAIGCVMSKREPAELLLNSEDIDFLCRRLSGKDKKSVLSSATKAVDTIITKLGLPESVNEYVMDILPGIADSVVYAVAHGNVSDIFVSQNCDLPYENGTVKFSYGRKMSDKTYRGLVEQINACESAEEKNAVISAKIKSFADFSDILADIVVDDGEMDYILKNTSPVQIAALVNKYELHDDFAVDADRLREGEKLLRSRLESYISGLSENSRKIILTAASHMKAVK